MKKALILVGLLIGIGIVYVTYDKGLSTKIAQTLQRTPLEEVDLHPHVSHPLTIQALRDREFLGSDITIEETLEPGNNYQRYLASYQSDGLKINALLTIPNGERPSTGWPVIVFNHGYIPPDEYQTTEKYIAYTDGFSRNGYMLLRPDYRGHGDSDGDAEGGYGSNAYTIDILNAVAAIKKHPDADPARIGLWGHSMGGHITLRAMVVDPDIKAGVVWAGVVASYQDLLYNWRRSTPFSPPPLPSGRRRWRQELMDEYGTPEENPDFWNSLSATTYLSDLSGPMQLHHGTADEEVPYEFSETLDQKIKAANKVVELYLYPGDNHNLSQNFSIAMQRSIEFFDEHVKGE